MARHGHGGGNIGATPGVARRENRGTNIIQRAVNFASRQIGDPYVWGGTGPNQWDCSGIVYAAYNHAGYTGIARTTYGQILQGQHVSQQNLRVGDIVFSSPHHEGLYVGNGMILSAPHTGASVHTLPLSQFGFYAARRLLRGGGGVIPPPALGGVSRNGLPVPHPSINPQLFAAYQHQMQSSMQQFQQQSARQQQQFQQTLTSNAAADRQANLARQLQQQANERVNAAGAAQRTLSGGSSGSGSGGPVLDFAAAVQQKNEDLRQAALQRAGIGGADPFRIRPV